MRKVNNNSDIPLLSISDDGINSCGASTPDSEDYEENEHLLLSAHNNQIIINNNNINNEENEEMNNNNPDYFWMFE